MSAKRSGRAMRVLASSAGLVAALVVTACEDAPQSPEGQILAMLAQAEVYAEDRDAGDLATLVSEHYADRFGHDRNGIQRLFAFHFLRHDTLHLLVRVDRIEILEPGAARAVVFVGMGGTDRSAPDVLLDVRADLYRVELLLAEEKPGEWKLTEADWRPARAGDWSEVVSPPT